MTGKTPGSKGPMGEAAHEDDLEDTAKGGPQTEEESELKEGLEETFPGSDAPSETRRENAK